MQYNQIWSDNVSYFDYMVSNYQLNISGQEMIELFSGIFLTQNSYVEQDFTFRLMGTYSKKIKEEKTKKKQIFSLGLKDIKKLDSEKATHIKKEFEKLVLVFTQMKHYEEIKQVEKKKEDLQNN